jgi:hypothetical protein
LRNYLPDGDNIGMAGRKLPGDSAQRSFQIELPDDYTLVDGLHVVRASLDGGPATDRWQLSSGDHQLITSGQGKLYLVWSQVWDRGWRPSTLHV